MTGRNLFRHMLRGVLGFLAVFIPLLWPSTIPITVVAFCSMLAYDGLDRHNLLAGTLLLLGGELAGGSELGVVALPFLLAAAVLGGARRALSLSPWAHTDGWHVGDLVRTVAVATVLSVVMIVGSVFVAAVGYGFGMPLERLSMALSPHVVLLVAIAACICVGILRRIDVPFRRKIRFGM